MNKLIDTLLRQIGDLRLQIEAHLAGKLVLTERAKAGIVVGGALLIFGAWLGLNAWVGGIEHHYRDARVNLARLKTQVESGAWSERKDQSHALRSVLEARLWIAETPGLAEASYERWMRDHINRNKFELLQLQIRRVPLVQAGEAKSRNDASDDPLASLQRMTAKILMPFDESVLLDVLADIAEGDKLMTIDRLVVRAGRNPRVEMDVSTFFRYHERSR